MQIVVDADNSLCYITDAYDVNEWSAVWAQVPAGYSVATYDVWPDDVLAALAAEGRTMDIETVTQYSTISMNGQWVTVPMPRSLYRWSAIPPAPPPAA